jgi:hypothetical protein
MNNKPRCCNNNIVSFVCANKACNIGNPFICDTCERKTFCRLAHKSCVKIEW